MYVIDRGCFEVHWGRIWSKSMRGKNTHQSRTHQTSFLHHFAMKQDHLLHDKILFSKQIGWTQAQTARHLNLHRSFVKRWWNRSNPFRKAGSGRPAVLRRPVLKTINKRLERNPRLSARKLAAQIGLSRTTTRRGIKRVGLRPYHRQSAVALTKTQIIRRLKWARQHKNKDFSKTMFVDEKDFEVADQPNPRNDIYYARSAEEVPRRPTLAHPLKIHVCAGVCAKGVTPLHMFSENMTGELYKTILTSTIIPAAQRLLGKGWELAQDNDPKHTSKIVRAHLSASGVRVLNWPSRSPDLNPIENLWSIVNAKLMENPPTFLAQLKRKLKKAWQEIDRKLVKKLIDSMPHRLQAVIQAKGAPTKY